MELNFGIFEAVDYLQNLRRYELYNEIRNSPLYAKKIDNIEQGLVKALFGSRVRPFAIKYLYEHGKGKVSDISEYLGVSPATLITAISPLISLGIINIDVSGKEREFYLNERLSPKVMDLAQNVTKTLENIEKYSVLLATEMD
ncbi:MAG: hypothetical protein NTW30_01895 [Candidatus Aenigmarchaeota archaeon]|nr:hypothetical protein [Candidatus Aenigmarchaeota archaeon]